MKKEEKNIVINEDNYKGYAELYRVQHSVTDEEIKLQKKYMLKFGKVFLTILFLLVVTAPFKTLSPIFEMILNLELGSLFIGAIGLGGAFFKKTLEMHKEKYQAVKEEYPYIDLNINRDALEKSLEDIGILQYEFKDGLCLSYLKVEEYENYLKAEEIKKNYFEETKYDGYIINPPIEQEELEKVKIKSLTR